MKEFRPEWVSGNVFIRPNILTEAGDTVHGHKHAFDHTTIVFKGAVRVRAVLQDGTQREQDFTAPAHFLVTAGVEHEITATQDDTEFWCIYSHRTPQGTITQEYTGWIEGTK